MEKKIEWNIEYGGIINNTFRRNLFYNIKDKSNNESIKEKFNNKDFYSTVYIYDDIENINNSNLYGPLIIDLDIDLNSEKDYIKILSDLNIVFSALNILMDIKEENILLYFSGNKGFHIVIPPSVFGIKPNKDLNNYYKLIALELKKYILHGSIDLKIYDRRRLIRMNNSINAKTGLYKVPIGLKQANDFSLFELKEYASKEKSNIHNNKNFDMNKKANIYLKKLVEKDYMINKPKQNKGIYIKTKQDVPRTPCLEDIINNGSVKGNRNNTTIALASILIQNGYKEDEALNVLNVWNKNKNEPPLPDVEIINTLNSAIQMTLNGKRFGCAGLKELGECNKKCKFFKENNF